MSKEAFKTLMEAMGYENITYTVKKSSKVRKMGKNKSKEKQNGKQN